jgi:enoyl-CoA hydratase/carnithine racemase
MAGALRLSEVLVTTANDVCVITLNRPQRLNAWTDAMRTQIRAALALAEADANIGGIVLTGTGERAFCSGQDVDEMRVYDSETAARWMAGWEEFFDAFRAVSKPLVAALNGLAVGSAFQVALLCDLRVGHPGVFMGQPEINQGVASVMGPWIMREVLGLSRTVELVLTGRLMDCVECERLGLLHRVVAREAVLPAAIALAQSLAAKPRVAMRRNKAWLRELTEPGFRQAAAEAVRVQAEIFASGEPAERMAQFLSRRDNHG